MTRKQRLTLTCAIATACPACLALTPEARSASTTVIYSFSKKGPLGIYPTGSLLADKNGVLYGTSFLGALDESPGGSVFSLTPPTQGQSAWTPLALYTFPVGVELNGGLVADQVGNLYGTTATSGYLGNCIAFRLSPSKKPGGKWTLQTLHAFSGAPDGDRSNGDLRFDASGSLYGTTLAGGANGQGVVFELTPPKAGQTAWTETILYSVQGSNGQISQQLASPLVIGEQNTLYGVTSVNQNQGQRDVAFRLSPPSQSETTWTYETIATFKGKIGTAANSGLTAGSQGVLYGITHSGSANHCGSVFSLVPSRKTPAVWRRTAIYSLDPAQSGCKSYNFPLMDSSGNLYAMTSTTRVAGGAVFEVSPPAREKGLWTEKSIAQFGSEKEDGSGSSGALTFGYSGALYGTAGVGGSGGYGTVYAVMP